MPLEYLNFRDLGGIPAGKTEIRPGILFRSEGPANFGQEQIAAIASLGIRNIIDLRSAREREETPHEWHGPDCHWHGLDVDSDLRVFGNEGRERLLQGRETQIAVDTMIDTYREIPQALLPHWNVIGECLQDDGLPVLVNCTAGKDRTGVAIALLLELAGVSRDAIEQDYLRSGIFGDNLRQGGTLEDGLMASYGFMPSPGQIDALIGVRSEYLHAVWDVMEQGWSGIARYFTEAGIGEAAQQKIKRNLVADRARTGS